MESSIHLSSKTNQGYSTPPRSTNTFNQLSTFSQPKLLTSAELKRRFSPIHSSNKKRRHNLIRKHDSIVPFERNLNMPVLIPKLFNNKDELSTNEDDCTVPMSFIISHRPPICDCLLTNSLKLEQENAFTITETIMKQKLKILLQKK